MQIYPTGLTDSQWAKIEKLFDNRKEMSIIGMMKIMRRISICRIEVAWGEVW